MEVRSSRFEVSGAGGKTYARLRGREESIQDAGEVRAWCPEKEEEEMRLERAETEVDPPEVS